MQERNIGIQLLRSLCMMYVIILHALGKGGILRSLQKNSLKYHVLWYLELCAYPAVNCFALISGYVGYSEAVKPHNYFRYWKLWRQIVFFNLFTNTLCFIHPVSWLRKKTILSTFSPLFFGTSWYFRCYTALFFSLPFLNNIPRRLTKHDIIICSSILIVLFSVIEVMHPIFGMNRGYSYVWLAFLYILGASMQILRVNQLMPGRLIVLLLVILPTLPLLARSYLPTHSIIYRHNSFLIEYTSPFVLLNAVLYVLLFSTLQLSPSLSRYIDVVGSSAFSAYILDDPIQPGIFRNIERYSSAVIVAIVLLYAVQFLFVAVCIDRFRLAVERTIRRIMNLPQNGGVISRTIIQLSVLAQPVIALFHSIKSSFSWLNFAEVNVAALP